MALATRHTEIMTMAPLLLSERIRQSEVDDRYRFTPVKGIRTIPRLWDRKPEVSFLSRTKRRKIWKRFHSTFDNMNLHQEGQEGHIEVEINGSKNIDILRGIKRLRIERLGRTSFLETKWQLEVAKRRKRPPVSFQRPEVSPEQCISTDTGSYEQIVLSIESASRTSTKQSRPIKVLDCPSPHLQRQAVDKNPRTTSSAPRTEDHVIPSTPASDIAVMEVSVQMVATPPIISACPETNAGSADDVIPLYGEQSPSQKLNVEDTNNPLPNVMRLTPEQQSILVRSALRSAIDGEDAELLNDFLSKAKAKRAAKAVSESHVREAEDIAIIEGSVIPELLSPSQTRQVLGDIDTNNSPSSLKAEAHKIPPPSNDQIDGKNSVSENNRVASLEHHRRGTTPPRTTRTTISLRRAKGTEFVFLQRTDAQELAIATRNNTKHNKGDAQPPKTVLEGLTRQQQGPRTNPATGDGNDPTTLKRTRKRKVSTKTVSWDEQRLVQYEGEERETPEQRPVTECCNQRPKRKPMKTRSQKKRAVEADLRKDRSNKETDSSIYRTLTQVDNDDNLSFDQENLVPIQAIATPSARRIRRVAPHVLVPTSPPVLTSLGRAHSVSQFRDNTSASGITERKKLTPKAPSGSLIALQPRRTRLPSRV